MSENVNQTVRDLAAALATARRVTPEAVPHVIVPQGYEVSSLERLLPAPVRIRAKPTFNHPDSFINYVNEFRGDETRIFACEKKGILTAAIDHPGRCAPTWSEHHATLALEPTPEWLAWVGIHRKEVRQVAFAEFIEEHTSEILEPSGAEMLEVALTLQNNRTAAVKSAIRLESGTVQFRWEEEDAVRAGKDGGVEIPTRFRIAVAPFKGLAPFKLDVLLRYRVSKESGVSFICVLKDHEKAAERGFLEVANLVKDGTEIEPLSIA